MSETQDHLFLHIDKSRLAKMLSNLLHTLMSIDLSNIYKTSIFTMSARILSRNWRLALVIHRGHIMTFHEILDLKKERKKCSSFRVY